jgi:hypothetical protein
MEPIHPPRKHPYRLVILLMLGVFPVGVAMQISMGNEFLFRGPFSVSVPVGIAIALLPAIALWVVFWPFLPRRSRPWVRWVEAPIYVLITAGILLWGARGWVVGVSHLLASQPGSIEFQVLAIEHRAGVGVKGACRPSLELRQREDVVRLCGRDLIVGAAPRPGDRVVARGRQSPLGFHILQMRVE